MALISCPNCGKQISEKASTCIHCGYVLKEEVKTEEVHCPECGAVIADNVSVCPQCGYPIGESKKEEPQKVEVTKVNIPVEKKHKKAMIAAAIAVCLLIVGVFGYKEYSRQAAEKAYMVNYEKAVNLMLSGASDAEDAGGLIHDVWYNTIYEESSSRTDKYTKESRYSFNDDFNTSLKLLWLDYDFLEEIDGIKRNQEEVQTLMKEMKNPPEAHKEAYDALKVFYDEYLKLVNLAVNPTGNLQSYTSDYNDADSATANAYKAAALYLEDD